MTAPTSHAGHHCDAPEYECPQCGSRYFTPAKCPECRVDRRPNGACLPPLCHGGCGGEREPGRHTTCRACAVREGTESA